MTASPQLWVRLHALGARPATIDAAVRVSDLRELWTSCESAAVLLDAAYLAGVDLERALSVACDILDGAAYVGARRWASAGLEALRMGERMAAEWGFGRILDALEVLHDAGLAARIRGALDVDATALALALGAPADVAANEPAPTGEDDLARILGSCRGSSRLPLPERDEHGARVRDAFDTIRARVGGRA